VSFPMRDQFGTIDKFTGLDARPAPPSKTTIGQWRALHIALSNSTGRPFDWPTRFRIAWGWDIWFGPVPVLKVFAVLNILLTVGIVEVLK